LLVTGIIRKAVREPLHHACNILAKVVLNVLEPQHPAVVFGSIMVSHPGVLIF
jgi:hypothetical protein